MNEPQNNEHAIDEQFADFTDKILAEETANEIDATFSPDPELRALEQTALRLKNAFGKDDPNEAVIHRMHQNITMQWQQQQSKEIEPIWKKWKLALHSPGQKWQSQRSRQRWSMAISLAVLFALMLVSVPLVKGVIPDQPAASGHSLNAGILAAFGGLVLLAILYFRRRQ
jgi:uncharacterized protein (TIGR03382 family)